MTAPQHYLERTPGQTAPEYYAAYAAAANPDDDARFLADHILDKRHNRGKGMLSKADLSILLEMDQRCHWGPSFTVSRFKAALTALEKIPTVVKEKIKPPETKKKTDDGIRWRPATATETKAAIKALEPRTCGRPKCKKSMDGLHASRLYCSDHCQYLIRQQDRLSQKSVD